KTPPSGSIPGSMFLFGLLTVMFVSVVLLLLLLGLLVRQHMNWKCNGKTKTSGAHEEDCGENGITYSDINILHLQQRRNVPNNGLEHKPSKQSQ
ncbi:hypothetical protein CHARACLAT_032849, partial [Characodon lateralis]|nr:hypothetical protein [Characodon lateralis]